MGKIKNNCSKKLVYTTIYYKCGGYLMATSQQILNACDEIMKNKIRELLWNFWVASTEENLKENIEHTTDIFFKIINMESKYCRPQEPKELTSRAGN
jgi:hypothetical protein